MGFKESVALLYNRTPMSIKHWYKVIEHWCMNMDVWCFFPVIQGVKNVDCSLYPSWDLQKNWLTSYLESYRHNTRQNVPVTETEVTKLYIQVCKFSLVSVNNTKYHRNTTQTSNDTISVFFVLCYMKQCVDLFKIGKIGTDV